MHHSMGEIRFKKIDLFSTAQMGPTEGVAPCITFLTSDRVRRFGTHQGCCTCNTSQPSRASIPACQRGARVEACPGPWWSSGLSC